MTAIPPGERRELRAVVRAQFKVLRAEAGQRKAELLAQAERQLVDRYRDEDKRVDDLNWSISQVVDRANREIRDLMRGLADGEDGGQYRFMGSLSAPRIWRKAEDRKQLHAALTSGIDAQVRSALLALDRQEADLLRQLAMEALEGAEAQEFLARIPTVADLVPSARLREIEAAFDLEQGGPRG